MIRFVTGALALLLAACGSTDGGLAVEDIPAEEAPAVEAPEGCADVIDATIEQGSTGYSFAVTVLSADTGWDKYADAWVVWGPGDEVLGERVLAHPHENEQPFTRSLSGVDIPGGIGEVTIAAHDSVLGFCGQVVVLTVPTS